MKLPKLRVLQSERQLVDAFRGYNHNLRIGDSEFYDMQNMTSDHYPVLSSRKQRGRLLNVGRPNGIIAKGELCRVEDGEFYIGNEGSTYGMDLSDTPKTMVSMGAYVIILPDKKWVNTAPNADGEYELGSLDAEFITEGRIPITTCDKDGKEIGNILTEIPEDPQNGDLFLDLSDPHAIQKYSAAQKKWIVADTYVKIKAPGIADNFNVGDGVVFLEGPFDGKEAKTLYGCNKEEDYILVKGFHYAPEIDGDPFISIVISRKMPDLDFITECNNRLWGCKYGETEDGTFVNQIYASKLGDFKNWNCFDGISTDSYTASCGSDGPFTGAITHLGCPLFFKENGLHKVYGDFPANFRIQYTPCRGVQEGSHKSLAVVGETLFYKSRDAVCAYDGSLPVEVSSAFGDVRYSNAVAGAHGNKYYINMKEACGTYHLFVYDTTKGLWHKEDNIRADCFCSHLNELYAIDHDTKNIIAMFGGSDEEKDTEPVSWLVETGVLGMSSPDMKYISRLMIRMSLEEGASVEVSIQYDSSNLWEQVCVISATSLRSFSIPIRPKRCDHFRLRIKGEGQCRIYSITKTMEQGSDIS